MFIWFLLKDPHTITNQSGAQGSAVHIPHIQTFQCLDKPHAKNEAICYHRTVIGQQQFQEPPFLRLIFDRLACSTRGADGLSWFAAGCISACAVFKQKMCCFFLSCREVTMNYDCSAIKSALNPVGWTLNENWHPAPKIGEERLL